MKKTDFAKINRTEKIKRGFRSTLPVIIIAGAALCFTGCSGGSKTAESTKASEAETVKETAADVSESAEKKNDAGESGQAEGETAASKGETGESETYTAPGEGGWKMDYIKKLFSTRKEGDNVVFTYLGKGENNGKDVIAVRFVAEKMPEEVLGDETSEYSEEQIERSEGFYTANPGCWSFSRSIKPSEKDPDVYVDFTAVEHNGGTILVKTVYTEEKTDEDAMTVSDNIAGVLDSFVLTDHKSQEQFAYIPGSYVKVSDDVKEEADAKGEAEVKEGAVQNVTLSDDHTGILDLDGETPVIWSSYEIIERDSDKRYEYKVEGDMLYIKSGDEWLSFERQK